MCEKHKKSIKGMVGFELWPALQIGALRHVAIGPMETQAKNTQT